MFVVKVNRSGEDAQSSEVTISGAKQDIDVAKAMVEDAISSLSGSTPKYFCFIVIHSITEVKILY